MGEDAQPSHFLYAITFYFHYRVTYDPETFPTGLTRFSSIRFLCSRALQKSREAVQQQESRMCRAVITVWMGYDLWERVGLDCLELTMTAVWVLKISTLNILFKSRPVTETEAERTEERWVREGVRKNKRVTIILLCTSPWMILLISSAVIGLLLPLWATVNGNNTLQSAWSLSAWHRRALVFYTMTTMFIINNRYTVVAKSIVQRAY